MQVSPAETTRLIEANIYRRLKLVPFSGEDYLKVLQDAGPIGTRGGAIYDLLILWAARKIQPDRIYTLNRRHFAAFAPDLAKLIIQP